MNLDWVMVIKFNVTINKDVVIVEDFGQGFIPNSFREDGKTILEGCV